MRDTAGINKAAIWGVFFLLAVVVQQVGDHYVAMAGNAEHLGTWIFFFAAYIPFFVTLFFHARGYGQLGRIFNSRLLVFGSYVFQLGIVLLGLTTGWDAYVGSTAGPSEIVDAMVGMVLPIYALGPAFLAVGVYKLRGEFGIYATVTSLAATAFFLYGVLIVLSVIVGFDMPHFFGSYIWIPLPEIALALSGISLMFRASN